MTNGALEAHSAGVHGLPLDAAAVEPGVLARWAPQGLVGRAVPHGLQADDAVGALGWSCLHCLSRAVLAAEGPVLPKELGDTFAVHGAGQVEAACTASLCAADGGSSLATNKALLLVCLLDSAPDGTNREAHSFLPGGAFLKADVGKKQAELMHTEVTLGKGAPADVRVDIRAATQHARLLPGVGGLPLPTGHVAHRR